MTKCVISEVILLHILKKDKSYHNLVLWGGGHTAVIKVIPLFIHFIFAISCVYKTEEERINTQLPKLFIW